MMADDQETFSTDHQVRLFLWSVPRSLSTVLTKCLSFVENSQIFFEPYFCAYLLGPERFMPEDWDTKDEERMANFERDALAVTSVNGGFEVSQCTYQWVKERLEEAHAGKTFIFCKDIASAIPNDKLKFLPRGYRHVFLIRHPLKVFPSLKKMLQLTNNAPPDGFQLEDPKRFPTSPIFKDLAMLIDQLKEHEREPIIIDADDLLRDPRGILSALFMAVGLPFEEKLLRWEAGDAVAQEWVISNTQWKGNQIANYYKNALDSTCFQKPSPLPDRASLSADILRCVDVSMPYYEKMYAQRLKPT